MAAAAGGGNESARYSLHTTPTTTTATTTATTTSTALRGRRLRPGAAMSPLGTVYMLRTTTATATIIITTTKGCGGCDRTRRQRLGSVRSTYYQLRWVE